MDRRVALGIKELVAQGYDRIADLYLQTYGVSAVRDRKLAELCDRLPVHARVLDLGCGAGVPVMQQLVARGFAVTGVEASATQIESGRRNVPEAQLIEADMMTVDLPLSAFDAVSAFYSITHVPRAEHGDLLKRIAGWLKPGGCLLASFGVTAFEGCQDDWLGTTMYFSHHGSEQTRRLVRKAGFRLEREDVVQQDNEAAEFLWLTARKQ